jgi:AcrR family transcriptional regulator
LAVSKETIVDISIAILNQDGVSGLSMRNIAKELQIKAASLYHHFINKEELFSAITERICMRIGLGEETDDPELFLTDALSRFRVQLLAVRDSVVIFENSPPRTPYRIETIRKVSAALIALGVPEKGLFTVANLFNNYVLSFVADEYRFKNTSPERLQELKQSLDPQDQALITVTQDFDEQFAYGLNLLFAGLRHLKD